MGDKPAETIQTLLHAEEAAKGVIDGARAARDARLKAATDEADAEIAAYRAQREEEYAAQVESYAGQSGDSAAEIARGADADVAAVREASEKNVDAVVGMLVSAVTKVNVAVPKPRV